MGKTAASILLVCFWLLIVGICIGHDYLIRRRRYTKRLKGGK